MNSPEVMTDSNMGMVDGKMEDKDKVMEDLQDLQRNILIAGESIRKIITEQESFEINCNEKQTMNGN